MARRFRFRLEAVQRIRTNDRDRRRRVVAEAVRAMRSVQQRIDDCNELLRASVDRTSDLQRSQRIDMHSLRSQRFYGGYLHRQLLLAGEELVARQTELDARRGELTEATKRLRAVEKLRERQWERHRRQLAREEQADADEDALQKYIRRIQRPVDECVT